KVAIDVRLDEVVLRALEKAPERRYQQAGQIKTDVGQIAAANPSFAPAADARLPMLLGVAIGLVLGGACITAGLAAFILAFVVSSPGAQEFWGWMGGAFGGVIGGGGS